MSESGLDEGTFTKVGHICHGHIEIIAHTLITLSTTARRLSAVLDRLSEYYKLQLLVLDRTDVGLYLPKQ